MAGQLAADVAGDQPVDQPGRQPLDGQHHGRPEQREHQVAAGPAEPAHRGAEQHLGVPGGLLVAQPQGRLDARTRRRSGRRCRRRTRSSCPRSASAPPIRAKMSFRPALSPARSTTLSPTPPKTSPSAANPTLQPSSSPRCSRQASASGERRPGAAVAGPRRAGNRPAPKSRRPEQDHAGRGRRPRRTARRARPATQSSAPYGKMCCTQPTGESQDSQASRAGTDAPRCRRPAAARRPAPSTTIAIDRAPRALAGQLRGDRGRPRRTSRPDNANSRPEPAPSRRPAALRPIIAAVVIAPSTRLGGAGGDQRGGQLRVPSRRPPRRSARCGPPPRRCGCAG